MASDSKDMYWKMDASAYSYVHVWRREKKTLELLPSYIFLSFKEYIVDSPPFYFDGR